MIRLANKEDFGEILRLSEEFWSHTQFDEPFEADHTLKMVKYSYDQEFLAVYEIDGQIIGFASGIYNQLMGSSKVLCGTEVAWWISPGHRSAGNGVRLLKFMENRAKELGIKYWNMVAMQSSMPDQVKKMYEKMGYTLQESTYTKVL